MATAEERPSVASVLLDGAFFYTGQYALLYILLDLSESVSGFLHDAGHMALLGLLVIQSLVPARSVSGGIARFFGSRIVPVVYTFQEALQLLLLGSRSPRVKPGIEFANTFLNVSTFLFL
jgi:hypothetical protein